MSTVHCSLNWSAQKAETFKSMEAISCRQEKEEKGATLYQPRDYGKGLSLLFAANTITSINHNIKEIAHQQLNLIKDGEKTLANPLGIFYCNPHRETEQQLGQLKLKMKDIKQLPKETQELLLHLGLNQEDLIKILPKIEETVNGFFVEKTGVGNLLFLGIEASEQNEYYFKSSMKPKDVENWEKKMAIEAMDFVFEKEGCTRLGPVDLPSGTLKTLNISRAEARMMSCYQYALAKIHVHTAVQFKGLGSDNLLDACTLTNGWRNVEEPDEGDLVVYYHQNQKKIVHAGIYKENGRVESKPGINNPTIIEHGLFDVMGTYGTSVFFMRRSSAKIA